MAVGRRNLLLSLAGLLAARPGFAAAQVALPEGMVDVRSFGARGDGVTLDTAALQRAIDAAAAGGGGTVVLPAGVYPCFTLRLRSCVTLWLGPGATLLAATPLPAPGGYDLPEPNQPWDAYQDFGHSHWHDSLIYGEDLHDVAIEGPGRIWGRGLVREPRLLPTGAPLPADGDKAIALKRCRNVTLRDVSILEGGHFAVLATGVDNLTIDNLRIDTNRDGIDIDCCRDVRITDCSINSPWDDAICLKSSLALGEARVTENVTITGCSVFGDYALGSLLDGTQRPLGHEATADPGRRTGRIKLGTESAGGFRNIAISGCTFQSCCGLAFETVDGGVLEDVTVTGVTMHDVRTGPLFLRLGARLRGPAGIVPGVLRRVVIDDLVCDAPRCSMPSIISGVPGYRIEDVRISNACIRQRGGGTPEMVALDPPEQVAAYPDPGRFGRMPAQGFFIRHARDVALSNVEIVCEAPDARPGVWLYDADDVTMDRVRVSPPAALSMVAPRDGGRFEVSAARPVERDSALRAVSVVRR